MLSLQHMQPVVKFPSILGSEISTQRFHLSSILWTHLLGRPHPSFEPNRSRTHWKNRVNLAKTTAFYRMQDLKLRPWRAITNKLQFAKIFEGISTSTVVPFNEICIRTSLCEDTIEVKCPLMTVYQSCSKGSPKCFHVYGRLPDKTVTDNLYFEQGLVFTTVSWRKNSFPGGWPLL